MSENQITKIEKLSFKNLYLVHINLSKNNISEIDNGAFENCANITILDMSYNLISNMPSLVFDNNTYATEWQLSYNNLTDMSQVSQALSVFYHFNIAYMHFAKRSIVK